MDTKQFISYELFQIRFASNDAEESHLPPVAREPEISRAVIFGGH
jgi:hypothetical protein